MNWFSIFGMALITFANRYAFFIQWVGYEPNEKVKRFLSFSSYAILTAIWAPIVLSITVDQGLSFSSFSHAGFDYVIATSLAILLSVFRAPSLLVVLLTTAVFFVLRFFVFS